MPTARVDGISIVFTPGSFIQWCRLTESQSQNILLIVNDGPYGNERPHNAFRLAMNLVKRSQTNVRIFLLGDSVACARRAQKTPDGCYNVERMPKSLARRGELGL